MSETFLKIPSSVEYDLRLQDGEKMLFGVLSSLCNKEGFCWATDKYLAERRNTSERTISRWLSKLKETGYIYTENRFENTDGLLKAKRIIKIVEDNTDTGGDIDPINKKFNTLLTKSLKGIDTDVCLIQTRVSV